MLPEGEKRSLPMNELEWFTDLKQSIEQEIGSEEENLDRIISCLCSQWCFTYKIHPQWELSEKQETWV